MKLVSFSAEANDGSKNLVVGDVCFAGEKSLGGPLVRKLTGEKEVAPPILSQLPNWEEMDAIVARSTPTHFEMPPALDCFDGISPRPSQFTPEFNKVILGEACRKKYALQTEFLKRRGCDFAPNGRWRCNDGVVAHLRQTMEVHLDNALLTSKSPQEIKQAVLAAPDKWKETLKRYSYARVKITESGGFSSYDAPSCGDDQGCILVKQVLETEQLKKAKPGCYGVSANAPVGESALVPMNQADCR